MSCVKRDVRFTLESRHYGEKYREIFARSHVKLELRETNGAVDNLRLLQDPKSGVDIGFVNGGVSIGNPPPGLLSIGLMYNNAFWIFYRSTETLDYLSQLKGRRIAIGPEGSGTRFSAEQVLGAGGITSSTAAFLPYGGTAAADALKDGKVDVAWVLGGTDAASVKALLHTPDVRLMNIPMAEAFTRIYPGLVRLVLPQGVFDIEGNIPPNDVTLLATTNRLLIRDDLHPEISFCCGRCLKCMGNKIFSNGPANFLRRPIQNIPWQRALSITIKMGLLFCRGICLCG
ncbi:MAG: TAXI family TRAP transporter solute-binding subunit [Pseudolabrys sp.]